MTVFRLRPGTAPNPYGGAGTVPDPSNPGREPLPGVAFQPGDVREDADGRPVVELGTLAFVQPGTLTELDEVEVDGVVYQVTGVVPSPRNPFTGWTPGGTATVRRVR